MRKKKKGIDQREKSKSLDKIVWSNRELDYYATNQKRKKINQLFWKVKNLDRIILKIEINKNITNTLYI